MTHAAAAWQLAFDFDAPAEQRALPAPALPIPASPAQTLAEGPPHRLLQHPDANRRILLSGHAVGYHLRRAARRTLGASISADGLVVSAPRWAALADVEAFLRLKGDWILRKLRQAAVREQQMAQARVLWRHGEVLPYLGEPVLLQLDPFHRYAGGGALLPWHEPHASGARRALQLALPSQASESQVRDAVHAWLMRRAKALFTERLDHFAPLLGVRWQRLSLSSADTRWGSAKNDGSIRLNWRLIHLGLAHIDYVVAHELSHLREMNHGPRFWDAVASVMPDYAERRRALRQALVPGN